MTNRYIPTDEVCFRVGKKSRITLWRWIKAGLFPKPRQVGPDGSGNVWLESELDEFFNDPKGWVNREEQINRCREVLSNEGLSTDEKREIWEEMKQLIKGRSKEQIKRMEIEQGLNSE